MSAVSSCELSANAVRGLATQTLKAYRDRGESAAKAYAVQALKNVGAPEADARHRVDIYWSELGECEATSGMKASAVKLRRRTWLWDNRVPLGVLTGLFGEEGLGKGVVTVAIAAQATRGTLPGMFKGEPVPVSIVTYEDDPETDLVPRLIAAGADLDLVTIHAEGESFESPLTLPDGLSRFEDGIKERGDRLLIVDPLSDALADNLKDNNNKDVRSALVPLQALAKRNKMAIIGVYHPNKAATSKVNKIMGSKAFRSVPRWVLFLGPDPVDVPGGDKRVLCNNKGNIAKAKRSLRLTIESKYIDVEDEDGYPLGDLPNCVWGDECDLTDDEIIAFQITGKAASADLPTSQIERARKIILDLIEAKGGELSAATAYAAGNAAGVSEKTMRRARAELKIDADADGAWSIPEKWSPPLEF